MIMTSLTTFNAITNSRLKTDKIPSFRPRRRLASNSLVTHSRGGGPVKSGSGVDFLELGTGLSAGSQNFANLN